MLQYMTDIRSFRRILTVLLGFTIPVFCVALSGCELLNPKEYEPGTQAWQYQVESGSYLTATPAITSRGDVLFGSGDNNLYCLSSDGELRWRFETSFGFQYRHVVAIGEDGTIYLASRDAQLYALKPDGSVKWKYLLGNEPSSGPGIGRSGTIYICVRDGTVRAIRPDGTEKWRYPTDAVYSVSELVMDREETVYCGTSDGIVFAIRKDGSLKWQYQTESEWFKTTSFHDHRLYLTSGDRDLYAFSDDGVLLWTFNNNIGSRGVTSGASIDRHGIIYVGTRDGHVVALNSAGSEIWRTRFGSSNYENGIHSTPLLGNDGSIYVFTDSGWLQVLNRDGSVQWSRNIGNSGSSMLAMGGSGVLYVSDSFGMVTALYTRSSGLADSSWPKERGNRRNSGQR